MQETILACSRSRLVEDSWTAWFQPRGPDAVVLACTEIWVLVGAEHAPLPVVDSALAHTSLLVGRALEPAVDATRSWVG